MIARLFFKYQRVPFLSAGTMARQLALALAFALTLAVAFIGLAAALTLALAFAFALPLDPFGAMAPRAKPR